MTHHRQSPKMINTTHRQETTNTMLRNKEMFLIITLVLIALPYGYEFLHEFNEEYHRWWDIFLEGGVMLLAISGIVFLMWDIHQRQCEMENLRTQLSLTRADLHNTRADLSELNEKLLQASRQYGQVIQEQMSAWEFTPSEKDVALLLLKGLSFEEIATIRDTKEKTVRQQATAIYRKSGLNGRHEFAAWFFEDFLS